MDTGVRISVFEVTWGKVRGLPPLRPIPLLVRRGLFSAIPVRETFRHPSLTKFYAVMFTFSFTFLHFLCCFIALVPSGTKPVLSLRDMAYGALDSSSSASGSPAHLQAQTPPQGSDYNNTSDSRGQNQLLQNIESFYDRNFGLFLVFLAQTCGSIVGHPRSAQYMISTLILR